VFRVAEDVDVDAVRCFVLVDELRLDGEVRFRDQAIKRVALAGVAGEHCFVGS
jgi:hypothetical protein